MAKRRHVNLIKRGANAWNAWRDKNLGIRPDLRGAQLLGALLSKANLRDTDLRDTDLRAADLRKADLRHANLRGSDLRDADLRAADLRKTDLHGAVLCYARLNQADLSEADLGDVDLSRADLSEADLSRAILWNTRFGNNDLSTTKGLEAAIHRGPSTIGVDTLFKSQGRIPQLFLRGVGLPEGLITYLPSLMAQPIEFYSCFISYSHADKSFAHRLHDALQGRGIRCWLDEHQLLPGDKIYTEVDRGIRLWDKVLLCCSKDALTSWWVDNEIKIAFDKEQHLWRERKKEVLSLIPLNLDEYLFSGEWQSGLATEVKARMAANFGGWEQDNKKFERQFERLVKALRTDGAGKELPPSAQI